MSLILKFNWKANLTCTFTRIKFRRNPIIKCKLLMITPQILDVLFCKIFNNVICFLISDYLKAHLKFFEDI